MAHTVRDSEPTGNIQREAMRQLRRLALSRCCQQLPIKTGGVFANVTPCFEQGQYDPCQVIVSIQKLPDVAIEHPSLALGNDKAKRLHDSSDLIAELDRDADNLIPDADQGTGQHCVERLDPDHLVKAGFGKLGQTICVIGIGLVERLVQYLLGMACFDADCRHPLGRERMVKPCCKRARLEDHTLRLWCLLADNVREKFGV